VRGRAAGAFGVGDESSCCEPAEPKKIPRQCAINQDGIAQQGQIYKQNGQLLDG
jgi:hypothetical protein